jgi:hypothetical protein
MKQYQHLDRKYIIHTQYLNQKLSQASKLQGTKFSRSSSASCCSSVAVTFYHSRRFCVCLGNSPRAAHTIHPVTFLSCLRVVFPAFTEFLFQNRQLSLDYECLFLLINFSAFSDLVALKYWTLYPSEFSALRFYFLSDSFALPRYY